MGAVLDHRAGAVAAANAATWAPRWLTL